MNLKSLITGLICISLLSCGIEPDAIETNPDAIVYDIVEVNNEPLLDWVSRSENPEPPDFDWPEKIELTGYMNGDLFKGRVRMHHLGWLEINNPVAYGNEGFSVITK